MIKLSKRQQQIYDFIFREIIQNGYPPTIREIGTAVGLASSSTVYGHLARMEMKGVIVRDPSKPRAIKIISLGHKEPTEHETTIVNGK